MALSLVNTFLHEMEQLFPVFYGENLYHYSIMFAIIFLVPVISYVLWLKTYKVMKVMLTLPGIPVRTPLGNLDGFLKMLITEGKTGFMKYCDFLFNEYGKECRVSRFWLAWRPAVAIFDTDVIETVISHPDALGKEFPYTFLHPWLGTGLLTSTGNKWKTRRRLLTPAFHFRILEDYLHVFNEQSVVLMEKLKEYTDKPAIDICPLLSSCTLDIICETAMGVQIGAQKNQSPAYVAAVNDVGKKFFNRVVQPWLWSRFLYPLSSEGRKYKASLNVLHNFTRQVIQERKKLMLEQRNEMGKTDDPEDEENIYIGKKKRKSFLDLLLHNHLKEGSISEEGIREEVDTFMFEGHDTTAMGIGWALYNIGLYPDVQARIQEELDGIFGNDTERNVTIEDIKEMKYLECVLKESLRIYPSVPLISRTLSNDVYVPQIGLTLPKGLLVFFVLFYIHRREETFPDAGKFDPDRFAIENSVHMNPFGYIPFSAGPRNCIGQKFAMMEEKVIVANILRHYSIRSVDGVDDILPIPELVTRSLNGIRLELRKRQTTDQ